MNKANKTAHREARIMTLGNHLRDNLQMLRGRRAVVAPPPSFRQFMPLILVLFCVGLMVGSVRARDSILVNLALLASRAFLLHGDGDELDS